MNYVRNQNDWNTMFTLLKVFKGRVGHCNVPFDCTEDGKNLGTWLKTQRAQKKKGDIDSLREKQLEDVGVVWGTTLSKQWEKNFLLLSNFKQREGHSNVPKNHIENGMKLGKWLTAQRYQKKKRKLGVILENRLEDSGVVWNIPAEQWESNYRLLLKFQQREGHSNVPSQHIEDGMKLGKWLTGQRYQKKQRKLDRILENRLEDLGVVWGVLSERWENNYCLLVKFHQREGHSKVPNRHMEEDTSLGNWLHTQRQQKKKGKLDSKYEKQLDEIGVVWAGVVWDNLSEQWENNYCLLVKFQQREGHSNVPSKHIEDGMKLGRWLSTQRMQKKKGKLDLSLEKRLEDVGVKWDVYAKQWERNYCLLLKFQQREGLL